MSTPELHAHVKIIKNALERAWPSIHREGSEEQRQILGAMYDSLTLAERLYYFPPSAADADWDQWRHDVIRPVSLCINSAELLLSDKERPLNKAQREALQTVFDESMGLSDLIDDYYAQNHT